MAGNSNYTADDKLKHEVEKLAEEIRVLQHPFRQPTVVIGGIALIVSLAGNIGQALTYDSQATIAKADVAQAKLDRFEMENKRDQAKTEFEKFQNQIASFKKQLNDTNNSSNCEQTQKALGDLQQSVTNLQQSAQLTTQSLNTSESGETQKYRIARDKEREGFQDLINGDYDGAQAAFEASENAYNSYHNVYELARLVRDNKSQLSNPAKKKEVFQKIVKDLSYGAPPDLLAQIKTLANQ